MRRIKALAAAAAVLLLMIFFTGTVSAENLGTGYMIFSAEPTEISDGTFSVTVFGELFEGASAGGMDISLNYDAAAFTVESFSAGAEFSTAMITDSAESNNVHMIWDSVTPYSGPKTELYTVKFTVNPEAVEGAHDFFLMCADLYDGTPEMKDISNNCTGNPLRTSVWVGDRLEITPSDITMTIGQAGKLVANKGVSEWNSTNKDIVSVDGSGNIQALSAGTAVVTAVGGLNGEETAYAMIRVVDRSVFWVSIKTMPGKTVYNQDDTINLSGLVLNILYDNGDKEAVSSGFTAQYDFSSAGTKQVKVYYGGSYTTFNVTVNANAPIVPDTITSGKFTVKNGYLSRIPIGMTVSGIISGINEKQYIKVYDKNGRQVTSGNAATGMKVKLLDGSIVNQTVTIVVTGDVNGDGAISVTDMINVKSQILKKTNLTGCYKTAADTNGDGSVSITDFIQVKAYILKKSSIVAR